MARNGKTLYEVLGVARNAKPIDIERAYARFKAEIEKESSIPNARRDAAMKMAYQTLADPGRRAEYDASLAMPVATQKKSAPLAPIVATVVLVAVGLAAYFLFFRAPPAALKAAALTPGELLEATSPLVGRVQSALMSGEVKLAGIAIAIAPGEMVTTCHGIAAGAQLAVALPTGIAKAELARASEELDVCALAVKEVGAFARIRGRESIAGETLYAVVVEEARPRALREARVARAIADPKGALLELTVATALQTGTPLIDSQGRLVGIVTTPHSFGEGLTVAIGPARIAQARTAVTKANVATP